MHMMMYRSKLSVRSILFSSGELRRPFKHFTRSGKGRDSRVPPSDFSIAIKDLGIQEHHITEIMILYISYVDLYLSIYLYIYIIYMYIYLFVYEFFASVCRTYLSALRLVSPVMIVFIYSNIAIETLRCLVIF